MAEKAAAKQNDLRNIFGSPVFRWMAIVLFLGLFLFTYFKMGGLLLSQTNITDKQMHGGDQMHNMRLATQTLPDLNPDLTKGFSEGLAHFFPHRTDGVVQPLWPWIAAWFTDADHQITEEAMQNKMVTDQDRRLFNRGRWFHVFMTGGFLLALGIAAFRKFSFPAACNLLLLGAFGAFLPRAVYFQPEPLFYMFFFLTWVACLSAFTHNTLWIYGLIGVLGGIAYMAKGSISPLLMVFVGVSSLRCFWELIAMRRRGFALADSNLWHWRNHLMGLLILGMAHFMTVGPRLTDAHEKFGNMFHSYPSYWMWMDRFSPDCYEWMDKHNSREELEAMTPTDKPSLGWYLQRHTGQEAITRLQDNTWNRLREFFWPKQTKISDKIENQKPWKGLLEWRGVYVLWLMGILLGMIAVLFLAAPKAEHLGQSVFRHGVLTKVLFIVGAFSGYSLAYGWYAPIAHGSGDRFMLSLYLPVVFSLIWGAESIGRRIRLRHGSPWITRCYAAAQWLLFFALAWRILEIFRSPHFSNS